MPPGGAKKATSRTQHLHKCCCTIRPRLGREPWCLRALASSCVQSLSSEAIDEKAHDLRRSDPAGRRPRRLQQHSRQACRQPCSCTYAGLLQLQGHYLESKPSVSIKIEGNADERGSREYNLALGQRRAEAVLKSLEIYGVKDAQMEAVSWGKERPKATGHDEAAWAQNRRADLVYPPR